MISRRCFTPTFTSVQLALFLVTMVSGCVASPDATMRQLLPLSGPGGSGATGIQDQNDLMPSASPNGEQVLFTSERSGTFRLYVMNRDGSDQHVISSGPGTQMQGSWSPDGKRIAYVHRENDKAFLAVMNADGSEPRLLTDAVGGWLIPQWSPDGGRILFHGPGPIGDEDLWSIRPSGEDAEVLLGSPRRDRQPALSPDGTRVVFTSRRDGEDDEIYVASADGGPWTQLTDNDEDDVTPSWAPDGTRVVFQSRRAGRWTIFVVNADGSGQVPITRYPMQWDPVWSHDGSEIFFNSARDGRRGIYVMNADGTYQRKLTNTEPSPFVTVVREAGVDEAARLFDEARTRNPEAVYFLEDEVRYLGENYLEMGLFRQAVLLFEANVEAYPESKTARVDLAKTYLAMGNVNRATVNYRRALEIDPDDNQISSLLKQLQAEEQGDGQDS